MSGPGTFALHDAADTLSLLPDGTPDPDSVPSPGLPEGPP
jgi:hypothetical protein